MNWDDVKKIKKLEADLAAIGFKLAPGLFNSSYTGLRANTVEDLPVYARDAEILLFSTVEEISLLIRGVKWARDYDRMLWGNNHTDQRKKKEVAVHQKKLVKLIKGEKETAE
jgi:hypothetical protein